LVAFQKCVCNIIRTKIS